MAPALQEVEALQLYNQMNKMSDEGYSIEELKEEVFPGVPRLEIRIGLEKEVGYYNPELLTCLYRIADGLDSSLDSSRPVIEALIPKVFSFTEYNYQKVVEQHRKYIDALKELKNTPDVVFAFPMYGALPIADKLKNTFPRDTLFPVKISGSTGVITGAAEVRGELPGKLLDPNNIVVFADDVADSCITATQLALKRRRQRLDLTDDMYNNDKYVSLVRLIQALREERRESKDKARIDEITKELEEKYIKLTPLFQEENVVIATLYSKNKPVYEALRDLTKSPLSHREQWINIQARLLEVCSRFSEDDWVIGGQGDWDYPLLDTSISGAELLEKVPLPYRDSLKAMGLDRLFLRIGAGLKPLMVFNPKAREALVREIANLVVGYMGHIVSGSVFQ